MTMVRGFIEVYEILLLGFFGFLLFVACHSGSVVLLLFQRHVKCTSS